LTKIVVYDSDPAAAARFAAKAAAETGIAVVRARAPEEAVRGADIVVTAGPIVKTPHATIRPGWLEEGAFASLVDYDSYWSREALAEVDKFCTDDVPQMEFAKSMGFFKDIPPVYAELGDLVSGRKPGRQCAGERTMACNLGLALDDMATAPIVFRNALEMGLGTPLDL
jgi:ornithine cyclodeaminase/alanine dehydrogenase-like protein (mu-crystallin family)